MEKADIGTQKDQTSAGYIQNITNGRPFVFVIMPYDFKWDFYEHHIKKVTENLTGLKCIRADDVLRAGGDLLEKIHLLIKEAEIIIADISIDSANVYYEVGYAKAIKKEILLIAIEGKEIPTDLKGLEIIRYRENREGVEFFDNQLNEHLKVIMKSHHIPLLKDMLIAENPIPAYIVSSPKYPASKSRILGQVYDERTFSDNLGILGLISAFGSFMFEGVGIELVSAQYCNPNLKDRDVNLYLIASKKVNPLSGVMLEELQRGRIPNWYLGAYPPGSPEEGDYQGCLYRDIEGKREAVQGKLETIYFDDIKTQATIWKEDYGIIVRGPHPKHKNRMVMIMAGAHSLGTGAACLAATRSSLILEIKNKLKRHNCDLADRDKTFWVLVKGTANETDKLLDPEGVTIEEVGVYE